mmetsp:Transcript_65680/g.180147  ORF Transcript_65680/g.180147 Transcript_65680/m.180147 type:complete len:285 (+) Transcript_65680:1-855(+)
MLLAAARRGRGRRAHRRPAPLCARAAPSPLRRAQGARHSSPLAGRPKPRPHRARAAAGAARRLAATTAPALRSRRAPALYGRAGGVVCRPVAPAVGRGAGAPDGPRAAASRPSRRRGPRRRRRPLLRRAPRGSPRRLAAPPHALRRPLRLAPPRAAWLARGRPRCTAGRAYDSHGPASGRAHHGAPRVPAGGRLRFSAGDGLAAAPAAASALPGPRRPGGGGRRAGRRSRVPGRCVEGGLRPAGGALPPRRRWLSLPQPRRPPRHPRRRRPLCVAGGHPRQDAL